jgi:hypothetical protein
MTAQACMSALGATFAVLQERQARVQRDHARERLDPTQRVIGPLQEQAAKGTWSERHQAY